ncbi:MAG: hypothetical protein B7Z74_07270, partial [Deltaproteobacteria bacterium 21-66-5]
MAAAILVALAAAWWPAGRRLRLLGETRWARERLILGSVDEVETRLLELESKYPQEAEIPFLLSVARRRAGAIGEARRDLRRAAELGWSKEAITVQHAICDFQSGDRNAEPFLLESLKAGCDDEIAGEIYDCLIRGYLADLYLREAGLCIDYWIQWRPDAPQPHAYKAELMHALGDPGKEVEEYRTLLRLDPDNRDARMKLGHLLLENRAAEEALEHFQHCRKLAPDDAGIAFAIAACQRSLGDLAAAEKGLRDSLSGDESSTALHAFALTELGQVAVSQRKYHDAAGFFQKALELSPADRTAHYALGLVLTRLGNKRDGDRHLEKSREIDEQNARLSELVPEIIRFPDDPSPRREAGEILLD